MGGRKGCVRRGGVRVVTQAAEWRMGILDHCTAHFNGSLLRALVLIARIQILIQGVLKIRKRFLNLALDRSLVLLDYKIENEWKSKTRILGILIMDHTLYFFMKDLPRFSGADTCIGTWKPRKILHEKSSVERQRFYVDSRYIFLKRNGIYNLWIFNTDWIHWYWFQYMCGLKWIFPFQKNSVIHSGDTSVQRSRRLVFTSCLTSELLSEASLNILTETYNCKHAIDK